MIDLVIDHEIDRGIGQEIDQGIGRGIDQETDQGIDLETDLGRDLTKELEKDPEIETGGEKKNVRLKNAVTKSVIAICVKENHAKNHHQGILNFLYSYFELIIYFVASIHANSVVFNSNRYIETLLVVQIDI